ncbi:MAG: ArsR/SmtB family transcription factor [Spirochaetaceae bacterium]
MNEHTGNAEQAAEHTNSRLIRMIKEEYSQRRCTDVQQLLSTMANPIRFRILCALHKHPFSVADLVEITDASLSNVSQQLKMMWMAGYVTKDRHGKQVVYSLNDERVSSAIDVLETMFPRSSYHDEDGCAE